MHFKKGVLSKDELEKIVKMALYKAQHTVSFYLFGGKKERTMGDYLSGLLSKVIVNRLNAQNKKYQSTLKRRRQYLSNWLMLKATVGMPILNNLLAWLDKHIEIYWTGSKNKNNH